LASKYDISEDDISEDDVSEERRDKVTEDRILKFVVTRLLESLFSTENSPDSAPLAITWLPALEDHLKIMFNTEERLEDFYDMLLVWGYLSLDRYADDQPISEWHSDLLSVAVSFGLESYVREKLQNLEAVYKKGRQLLHYALGNWWSYPNLSNVRLLLSKDGSPDCKFDSRTTWEYLLALLYKRPGRWRYYGPENLFSFLEVGANPNQRVNLQDLQCSALHLILSVHNPSYERVESVLQAFLNKGADVTLMDSNGCTVIELARKNFPNSVDMLRRAEA